VTQTILPPRNSAWLLPFAAALLLSIPSAHAQVEHKGPAASIALAASLPPYDVASVKQNISGGGANDVWSSTGIGIDRFTATNVPLLQIVELAYDVKEDQIFGLTGPIGSTRFDIEAKVVPPDGGGPPKLSGEQLAAMIIPLLADRFHLTAHLETKTMPVYELVVARGGPKFQLSQTEAPGGSGAGGKGANWSLNFTGGSMADLASMLSDAAHRKVIDKTGLTGRADITLKWSDDVAAQQGGLDVVSIFTAVEEQLGLKLQSSKGPVETLVIDHVEMPSEN
jgi:uncharacterized protein (TIGR03435 family)